MKTQQTQTIRLLVAVALSLFLGLVVAGCKPQAPPATPTLPPTVTPTAVPPTLTPTATPSPGDAVAEGEALLAKSDLAGAETAFQRALDIDPDYAPAHTGLSRVYYWQGGREAEAIESAARAVELDPESALAYTALSQAYLADLNIVEALAAAEAAKNLAPEDALVMAVFAEACTFDFQYNLARINLENAYALNPDSARVNYAIAMFHESTGDANRAEAALRKAVELEPDFFAWRLLLGTHYQERGRYEAASSELDAARELAPESINVLLAQAGLAGAQHDEETALALFEQALATRTNEKTVLSAWGQHDLGNEDYDQAKAHFEAALEIDSNDSAALFGLGQTYLAQEECDLAEDQFDLLLEYYPRSPFAKLGQGTTKLCREDATNALLRLRLAAALDPYNYEVLLAMSEAHILQEKMYSAKDNILDALDLMPALAQGHTALGRWYTRQEMMEEAEAEFKIALALSPNDFDTLLGLGDVYLQTDRLQDAQQMAEDVMAMDDDHNGARRLLGMVKYLLGEPKEAQAILEAYLQENPDDALANLYLGLTYRDLGSHSKARQQVIKYKSQIIAGGDLKAGEDSRIDILINALEEGYQMTAAKATEDMTRVLGLFIEPGPEIYVQEEEDGSRTLVVEIEMGAQGDDDTLLTLQMTVVGYIASIHAPRIHPEISNGLLIQFNQWGKPEKTAKIPYRDLKNIADALVPLAFNPALITPAEQEGKETPIAQMKSELAKMRELAPRNPISHEYVTQEAFEERLVNSVDDEVRESLEMEEVFLEMLEVITTTTDLEEVWIGLYSEQVLGYYVHGEDTLYIIEGQESTSVNEITIAHEYIHALQDQAFDLEALTGAEMNDDQELALDALIEGDATLASTLYSLESGALGNLLEEVDTLSRLNEEQLKTVPPFLRQLSVFPYLNGTEFVADLYKDGGWEAVNQAFLEPPQSTEHILHPERYRRGELPKTVTLPSLDEVLGEGWEVSEENVMGELVLQLSLADDAGPTLGELAAEGWGGDRYVIMENKSEGATLMGLRIVLDSVEEAEEFWKFYLLTMAHRLDTHELVDNLLGKVEAYHWTNGNRVTYAMLKGDEVTIIIGPDREVVDTVAAALAEE